jgi:hypothetical protein
MHSTVKSISRRNPKAEGILHVCLCGSCALFNHPDLLCCCQGQRRGADQQLQRGPVHSTPPLSPTTAGYPAAGTPPPHPSAAAPPSSCAAGTSISLLRHAPSPPVILRHQMSVRGGGFVGEGLGFTGQVQCGGGWDSSQRQLQQPCFAMCSSTLARVFTKDPPCAGGPLSVALRHSLGHPIPLSVRA